MQIKLPLDEFGFGRVVFWRNPACWIMRDPRAYWFWLTVYAALPLSALAFLVGCAGQSLPPGTPTSTDIRIIREQIAADDTPADEYLIYGTTLAARNCIGWFSTQIAAASQTSALSGTLGTLIGIAGAAGGPYGAGAAAAMGAITSAANNSQQNAPAGIDPVASYVLTHKVAQAWLAMAPVPTSKAEAYMLVEDFAEKCQTPEIRSAMLTAAATVPVRAIPMSASYTFGFAPEARPRVMPPAIVIGDLEAEQSVPFRRRAPKPLQWPANVDRITP